MSTPEYLWRMNIPRESINDFIRVAREEDIVFNEARGPRAYFTKRKDKNNRSYYRVTVYAGPGAFARLCTEFPSIEQEA